MAATVFSEQCCDGSPRCATTITERTVPNAGDGTPEPRWTAGDPARNGHPTSRPCLEVKVHRLGHHGAVVAATTSAGPLSTSANARTSSSGRNRQAATSSSSWALSGTATHPGSGAPRHSQSVRTTTTGHVAWPATWCAVEPSSRLANPPRPRVPTTSSSAVAAAAMSSCAVWPILTSGCTTTG